jgi:hypothetical protein
MGLPGTVAAASSIDEDAEGGATGIDGPLEPGVQPPNQITATIAGRRKRVGK